MMLPEDFEPALDQIETQLDGVAQALAAGDAIRLEAASASLQRISVALSQFVGGRPRGDAAMAGAQGRLQRIVRRMAIQREGLLRQAASVERRLGVLIPAAKPAATYCKPVGARRYSA